MARYIDADELKKCSYVIAYKDEWHMTQYGEFVELADIENAPTADVRENVHAHWYGFFDGDEYRVYCSHCKDNWYEEDLWMGGNEFPKYCPNCGARMEGTP